MAEQTYKTKVIYSGCGCETIKHFPDFCPKCRIAELERLADKVKNGFQGGCWCCETVGMKNVELHAKLERVGDIAEELDDLCWEMHEYGSRRSHLANLSKIIDKLQALKDNSNE